MTLGRVSAFITLGGALFGVMWYVWGLESRLQTFEAQSLAVIVGSEAQRTVETDQQPYTLETTCSQLALKFVDLVEAGSFVASQSVESLMKKLSCIK